MFGQRLPGGFSLGEEVARDGVERAELYGGGLVVLTRRCIRVSLGLLGQNLHCRKRCCCFTTGPSNPANTAFFPSASA